LNSPGALSADAARIFVKDLIMGKLSFMLIAAAGLLAVAASPARAAQALPSPGVAAADVVPVAEGCG
jgi:hypothetical protein